MLVRRGAAPPHACTSTRQDRTRHGSNGKAAERTGGHEPARTRPKDDRPRRLAGPSARAARVTHQCPRTDTVPIGKPLRPHPHARNARMAHQRHAHPRSPTGFWGSHHDLRRRSLPPTIHRPTPTTDCGTRVAATRRQRRPHRLEKRDPSRCRSSEKMAKRSVGPRDSKL